MDVAESLSTGTTCDSVTNSIDFGSWDISCSLPANQQCNTYGYIVVPDYYSPAAPSGNSAALHQYVLDGTATTSSSGSATVQSCTGPGASVDNDTSSLEDGEVFISLDGSSGNPNT